MVYCVIKKNNTKEKGTFHKLLLSRKILISETERKHFSKKKVKGN